MSNKLIVILGPTTSGKSSLAINLAQKFNGEIISADSRQVYKGMDIGTGKVTKAEQKLIKHYLLDVSSPKKQFTVSDFKRLLISAIAQIRGKDKLPFLVGGSPFYIYAAIDNLQIPEVTPNQKLRNQLRRKTTTQLFAMLKKLDPVRAKNIDKNNPRRLIRAIEIVKATGKPVPPPPNLPLAGGGALIIGIKKSRKQLYKLIDQRLEQRLNQGMVNEVKKLLKQKISHKRLQEMGLEYRFISLYLQDHLTYEQMVEQLKSAIHKFSKRQMTWFQTDKRIKWISSEKQAERLIKDYIKPSRPRTTIRGRDPS
ncbi:MAG: tRNA (adenosine(37)-N6)-dimethylallyltransferase MiaA [Candidatus Doudnabacteria bacterium RIFCSPLOWO2_02_FULL_42_9]|uniref:tRNA dimethylallyltransferase n=1 Tax=Candidatus Doudnabacteria bacterium RIFCSPHIGHO2_01_FULL_41_86 TaxID=1817821 RepID=A0A1F5N7R5_9BACT|nr:MAG: tRNA (adenosine(37)-N6)-dimethylallyltransferase MiaA [Candidatus Doudnabacteria bacterium RIFCSPHIGHO2_01_FULL_41_86]OGE74799.1 MAG: tRNA (adenosine(37)-N6)-dimethylallyltransferase MiaA [Candidatus Doudnabacteria bacterium RIFCSPHIGHO2_01_43_10]OGE85767.1 MAG: tRNA (adenosine(37)-N6)-dimethylallyltransferase MiaA [Candidatus Doudnabacteria bacterium RIFCSPHIGHO2_12_FULL_42_22]OGE87262.1 MAG: tRNA (adenosine(37)-N6)-dimethylallyltransferase MiaA [Candidatus Doudnabacteria bacterium RIFC